jgi:hypothetical protein
MIMTMFALLHSLAMFVINILNSPRRLEVENLFLRHQLNIALRRAPPRLRSDRTRLVWMSDVIFGKHRLARPYVCVRTSCPRREPCWTHAHRIG